MASPMRSKFEPYKPPAEFGQRVRELTKMIGKTPEELVRAVGYSSKKTLDRLARGEGSIEFALAIRDQLRQWGADVSGLTLVGIDGVGPLLEPWEVEWLRIGRELHREANEAKFNEVQEELKDLILSHQKVALGTGSFSHGRRR